MSHARGEGSPFESEEEERAYIEKKGLDKFACSKHGLDYDLACLECHDQFKKWVDEVKVSVVSSYGSTSRVRFSLKQMRLALPFILIVLKSSS